MADPRLPRFLYVFLFLACLLMMAYYYPQMPERMASHFAADGRANGWQSRKGFFVLMLLVTSVSAVVCFLAPRQIAAQPNARINLPNRDYWLAPERREETMRFISATMAWFGCGILLVLIPRNLFRPASQPHYRSPVQLRSHARGAGLFSCRLARIARQVSPSLSKSSRRCLAQLLG